MTSKDIQPLKIRKNRFHKMKFQKAYKKYLPKHNNNISLIMTLLRTNIKKKQHITKEGHFTQHNFSRKHFIKQNSTKLQNTENSRAMFFGFF